LLKYLKTSGLDYVLNQIIKVLIFHLGCILYKFSPIKKIDNLFYEYKNLARIYNIPVYKEKNVNEDRIFTLLSDKKIDLFVSALCNQILKNKILSIPKFGTINIHPALLPEYKGISPVFWALANGEKTAGVTIHTIDDEKIDEGKILFQKKIFITPSDTEHSLYLKCIKEGIILLHKAIEKIKKNDNIRFRNNQGKGSYFSLPTKDSVRNFRKQNRKFFKLEEFLK